LAASVAWALGAAIAGCRLGDAGAGRRIADRRLDRARVLSHWFLDALVHAPELPLAGSNSTMVGAGLWNNMPLALGIEALILVAGSCCTCPAPDSRRQRDSG
jgi:hypothetical protein